MINIIRNRLKIIFQDRLLWALFVFVFVFFALILNNFIEYINTGSKMPIVVIDEDDSDYSKSLLKKLDNQDSLYIINTNDDNGFELLKDGKAEALYYIPKGYQDSILNMNYNEIVKVYYLEGSTAGKVISDIFASEMLYDICTVKSLNLLEQIISLKNKEETERIIQEAKRIIASENREKVNMINIHILSDEKNTDEVQIDNSFIYKKVILGLVATFIAFILLFTANSLVKDKELGIYDRLKTIRSNNVTYIMSNIISLFFVACIISIFLCGIIIIGFKVYNFYDIISLIMLIIFYAFSLVCFLTMYTTFIKHIITFQISGALILILFSVIGGSFFNTPLINGKFVLLTKIMPNYWLVEGSTIILVNSATSHSIVSLVFPLFVLGVIFALLGIVFQKINE